MITYKKLSNMAILAFKNGLRLHFDSFILFEKKSYPSATMLSILAMEEFGKYFSLSAYVFYTSVNKTRDEKFEKDYIFRLYNHPFKQMACFGRDGFEPSIELLKKVESRYFENLKQKSLYVGFDREKNEILFNKAVNNPEKITNNKAIKQISFLNKLLIRMVNNNIIGITEMDEDEINELLNKDLLGKLQELEIKHYA